MRRAFSPSPLPPQNMTKELDLIELFAPQEILQDFDFEKLVDENGIYRIYMVEKDDVAHIPACLLYTSPSPRDVEESRMPSSA